MDCRITNVRVLHRFSTRLLCDSRLDELSASDVKSDCGAQLVNSVSSTWDIDARLSGSSALHYASGEANIPVVGRLS